MYLSLYNKNLNKKITLCMIKCVCFGCMYMYISDHFANKLTLNVPVKSFMCV